MMNILKNILWRIILLCLSPLLIALILVVSVVCTVFFIIGMILMIIFGDIEIGEVREVSWRRY